MTPADADFFGSVADISDDGNFIAIGAGRDDGVGTDDNGSVYMFVRTGDNIWTQQQKINNPDVSGFNNYFGGENHGVSLSSDGTYLIVGAYGRTSNNGAVFFFKRTGSSTSDWAWSLMLPGSTASQSNAGSNGTYFNPLNNTAELFGRAVRMSPDGLTALVHSRCDVRHDSSTGTDVGAVHLYTRTGDNWIYKQTYWSRDYTDSDHFGSALDISTDGSYFVAGMLYDDDLGSQAGAAYIFTRDTKHTLDTTFDLQANTWHNLTYAYQGEGGSKVTYLDGRKVAEEQAFDSFQRFPPFALLGHIHGGYITSASSEYGGYYSYEAFDNTIGDTGNSRYWSGHHENYSSGNWNGGVRAQYKTNVEGVNKYGEWLQIEFPYKINYAYSDISAPTDYVQRLPRDGYIVGSNDLSGAWTTLHRFEDMTRSSTTEIVTYAPSTAPTKAFKYFRIVIENITSGGANYAGIDRWNIYGHRENDLVRLPDPTNVLKYPHIAMTGPAQRGYTTRDAQLEVNNDAYQTRAWKAFRGTLVNNTDCYFGLYVSGAAWYYNTDGTFNSTSYPNVKLSSQTPLGDYITLGLPHKLVLNSFDLTPRTIPSPNANSATQAANESPQSFEIWGSNDNSTWYHINTYDNTSITPGTNYAVQPTRTFTVNWANSTSTPNVPTGYKHIGLVVKSIFGNDFSGVRQLFTLGRWRLYGTEEDTSIPIQIGGGNIDKVANFRVYDKFIGEDQALEIWDAQKDTFGRAKSSMTLHKGRLGIGTTEPEGRLAVADEPELGLEGLQEFPPGPMSTDNTYIGGHGMFKASASSVQATNNNLVDKKYPFRAFDQNDFTYHEPYYSSNPYNDADGAYTANAYETAGYYGEWLQLELPYKIKLNKFTFKNRQLWGRRMPKEGVLLAFDKKVGNWVCIHKHYDGRGIYGPISAQRGGGSGDDESRTFIINKNTDDYYDTFRFVTTRLFVGGGSYSPNISGWRLFGTRESINKQSVLHDGRLTLTKSLDVPRIGPHPDRDDTPRRDRLIAEFNTYTNPIHNTNRIGYIGKKLSCSI